MEVMETHDRLAKIFQALSHPVRLYILEALSEQECCVCHLAALLGRPQPYVSQQLATLREAGLISDRSEGTYVYYHISDEQVVALLTLARELLRRQGKLAEFPLPTVSEGPIAGCPCPRCQSG